MEVFPISAPQGKKIQLCSAASCGLFTRIRRTYTDKSHCSIDFEKCLCCVADAEGLGSKLRLFDIAPARRKYTRKQAPIDTHFSGSAKRVCVSSQTNLHRLETRSPFIRTRKQTHTQHKHLRSRTKPLLQCCIDNNTRPKNTKLLATRAVLLCHTHTTATDTIVCAHTRGSRY